MKKLSNKQKLICFIAVLLVAVIIAIFATTNVINNNIGREGYSATTANSNSNLIANYILNGITIGGITGKMNILNTNDATATAEDIAYGKTAYVKGKKIVGKYRTLETAEIGDYIELPVITGNATASKSDTGYTNDQTYTLNSEKNQIKWRVLSKDGENVKLIGETSLKSDNSDEMLNLYGAQAYVTGYLVPDQICNDLYGNLSYVKEARSVKVEDLNEALGIEEEDIRELNYANETEDTLNYGDTYSFSNAYSPESYLEGSGPGQISGNVTTYGYYVSHENIDISHTYVKVDNKKLFNTIFDNVEQMQYWLSDRGALARTGTEEEGAGIGWGPGLVYVENGLYMVRTRIVTFYSSANGYTEENNSGRGIRPIIVVNKGMLIESGDGQSLDTAYVLSI